MPQNKFICEVAPEHLGLRLDKFLAHFEFVKTRSRALNLIEGGFVKVNSKAAKASHPIRLHDVVEVTPPDVQSSDLAPLDLSLDIVFEDEDLIVVNKPSGLVVHPAAGHAQDTLVNALMSHTKSLSMKFGEDRPGIVHRIDKETSGLLVVAKNDFAHEFLSAQFKNKTSRREYFAVCCGFARLRSGRIQSYLLRHPVDRKRYASRLGSDKRIISKIMAPPPNEITSELGKWAVTNFEVLQSQQNLHLLKLMLETGRTHQIRVHLSEFGLPIVGDHLYGFEKKLRAIEARKLQSELRELDRFFLHAALLGFKHPRTGEELTFTVDWPQKDLERIRSWGLL